MSLRKLVIGLTGLGLLAVVMVGQLPSQEQERPRRGARGEDRPRMGREEMQTRTLERIKTSLQLGEAEWKAVEPKLKKVMTLSDQSRRGMRFRGRGEAGGRGPAAEGRGPGQGEGARARELTDVEKCANELRTVVGDEAAKPKQIKAKLTALREARAKAKKELQKAQQELIKSLDARQEAQLVLMGTVE
jgi:hypothetical protein